MLKIKPSCSKYHFHIFYSWYLFFGIPKIIQQHTSTTIGFFCILFYFSLLWRREILSIWQKDLHKREPLTKSPLEYPYPPIPLPTQKNSSEHNLFLAIFRETAAIIQEQWGSLFYSKSKCFVASNVNILINGFFFFFNSLLPYLCSHSHRTIRTEAALNFYSTGEKYNTD